MIQIDSDLYTVDLHLTDAEAGILLETAFDLMESRGQRGKVQETEAVEIEPEAFAGTITINAAANSAFDKSELALVGRMTHLIRFADIIPDLNAKAVYRDGVKSVELTDNWNHTVIEIPKNLDKLALIRRMIEAVQVMRAQE